ncbi:hypothetical protein GH714_013010 [Hevea brasiliensis]|uniref:Protein kinase domain-containing protein n=1 Tax=Hevea brasiliensis TaxID=3981 RepID=A0A6A6LBE2_HEVBR|nr:hypothetical protein GH714_013010 [Hevea brasiliensis]
MWNNISGSIPKEIGEIESLELLLLNGNQLTGPLPEELGYLPNLDRIQIDENHISGSIPVSFAYLNKTMHFHMNNNSISGQIPPELSRLPSLVHFLLDNNNLSGYLPPQLSELPNLQILQLDNNNFDGATIPDSYGNMTKLLKLSLRNCSLQGPIPDLSRIPNLGYLDLSTNQLNGSIPSERLSENITTIDLSNNDLTGSIPASFSGLPCLQKLSVANNSLNGSISSTLWQSRTLNASERLKLDFENNRLTNISGNGNISLPQNVSLWLQGNPVCSNSNLVQFCGSQNEDVEKQGLTNFADNCPTQACPYVYSPTSPVDCFCAAPLIVGYRLKSPGFSNFLPYRDAFKEHLTSGLNLELYQLYLENFQWEEGPRLKMQLQLFPVYDASNKSSHVFNASEVLRIMSKFTGWDIHHNEHLGLTNFLFVTSPSSSGTSKGALAGIVLGAIAGTVALCSIVSLLIIRMYLRNYRLRNYRANSRRRHASKALLKIDGIKDFTYAEMALATNNFNSSTQVGQGGYGIVYKGILADGTVVAIKRAQEHSLQGEKEFLTEIELLSRLHHRNLVSLVGYCDEEYEQVNFSYQSGMIFSFIDGRMGSYPSNFMEKFLNLAMKCCHDETDSRPSMADVVRELETIWVMIAESDMKTTDTVITDPGKSESSPSSSSMVNHPYVSSDVSGSDLGFTKFNRTDYVKLKAENRIVPDGVNAKTRGKYSEDPADDQASLMEESEN